MKKLTINSDAVEINFPASEWPTNETKSPTANEGLFEVNSPCNLSSNPWPKAVDAFSRPFISFGLWINGFRNDIFPSMKTGSMDSWILLINFHWKFMDELNWLTCLTQNSLFRSNQLKGALGLTNGAHFHILRFLSGWRLLLLPSHCSLNSKNNSWAFPFFSISVSSVLIRDLISLFFYPELRCSG